MPPATVLQHCTVEELGSSLRFVGPYRTQWVTTCLLALGMLFIALILVALTWSEIALIQAMGFQAFVVSPCNGLGSLLFLLIGASELVELLWQVMGQEVLEVYDDAIVLRHQILGVGITRRYSVDTIGSVVVSPPTDTGLTALHTSGMGLFSRFGLRRSAFQSFKRGRVALTSGSTRLEDYNTVHFGSSLSEDEAQYIVAIIHRKFRHYGHQSQGAG